MCPYSELFWFLFSNIRTEYGDLQSKSAYSRRMRENTDQKNFEYGQFLRSVLFPFIICRCHLKGVCYKLVDGRSMNVQRVRRI